jgi:hypothetical protein
MFKRKTELKYEVPDWAKGDPLKIHYLGLMYNLNDSQKRMGKIDGGEYAKTYQNINDHVQQLWSKYKFDEMMGFPLENDLFE